MKIVQMPTPNLRAVPESLRRLANQIEAGEAPEAEQAVVISVTAGGLLDLYAYGDLDTSVQSVVGLLHLAILKTALELQRGP